MTELSKDMDKYFGDNSQRSLKIKFKKATKDLER
jgi:hypothetical protein